MQEELGFGAILKLTEPVKGKDMRGNEVLIYHVAVVETFADGRISVSSAEEGKYCLFVLTPDPNSLRQIADTGKNRWN